MDPLIEIPREKWLVLRDLYKDDWPEGVVAYCALDAQYSQPALNEDFGFKVYCPEGDLTNGMVAVSERDNYYQIMIQPIGKDTKKIEDALLKTNILKWHRAMIPSTSVTVVECLEKIQDSLGIKLHYGKDDLKAFKHVLNGNTGKFDVTLPPNTFIGPLKPEHISAVNKTWTYCGEGTDKFFKSLMKNSLTYVLYHTDQETNEEQPVAWISVNEFGALTHLYTEEDHRRKGYGEVLTKYAINKLLAQGRTSVAYTMEKNINPRNLFTKLGFEEVGYDYWVFVTKNFT